MEFKHTNSSLSENDEESFHVPNVLYENRHCNQNDFSILICGGVKDYESEFQMMFTNKEDHISKVVNFLAG